tara:strand:- start:238994 stop:239245 length:252 start_codon:yes stop_codon:yes gene_type:complete
MRIDKSGDRQVMQEIKLKQYRNFNKRAVRSDSTEALKNGFTAEPVTDVEGWGQCLQEQITKHPQMALKVGLLAGIVMGWWVKR